MKSEKSYYRLGLFILAGLAVLVAGVIILGVGSMFTKTIPVETITLESVEGLDPGAPVKFRGVTIGKVAKINMVLEQLKSPDISHRIKAGNQILVLLALDSRFFRTHDLNQIRENFRKAAEAGLRARITSSGIAGPSYVELVFLDPKSYPPPQVILPEKYPYVPSAPSELSRIGQSLASITRSLEEANLQKVIGHIDQLIVTTTKTVTDVHMSELSQQLNIVLDNLSASTKRLHEILADPQINAIVSNTSSAMAGVNKTINGEDVKAMIADLPKVTARARGTMERVEEIVRGPQFQRTLDGLNQTSETAAASMTELRRTLRSLDEILTTQQQDIQQSVANLRRVMENMASLTEDAKRNPSRVLFGQPPPRVKPGE